LFRKVTTFCNWLQFTCKSSLFNSVEKSIYSYYIKDNLVNIRFITGNFLFRKIQNLFSYFKVLFSFIKIFLFLFSWLTWCLGALENFCK
jgi:hypothetical protein